MSRKRGKKPEYIVSKKKILIISDGETELNYLLEFISKEAQIIYEHYDINEVPYQSNTRTIMNYVKKTHYLYDYIFAMSDKDGDNHKKDIYNSFCISTNTYGNIYPGYTNPCFELFLRLHDNCSYASINRKELRKHFEHTLGKKYKTDKDIYDSFSSKFETAVKNSIKLKNHWDETQSETSFCNKNPISNVHEIIEEVLKLKVRLEKTKEDNRPLKS